MSSAILASKDKNFTGWYKEVIEKADLSELSEVRGCMVIKPYGYAIWERIQLILNEEFKKIGVQNAYFPLFIPLELFESEAEHVDGFAQEMAIVTHHKLERKNGKLVPSGELEMPLVVRPTSELIIGKSFSRWIKSYRDLPLQINQWANVVRWEMRPRMFLRTAEFLWQEGHTAHSTENDAINKAIQMHHLYQWFIEKILCISTISGKKPSFDKFAGAIDTYTLEGRMPTGKALQMCTSHYLGQNFAKATNIRFQNNKGEMQYAYTTSWGLTTRVIGGLIMVHGDNDGLRLPSKIAPYQLVIIPIIKNEIDSEKVMEYCNKIYNECITLNYRVLLDNSDITPQDKKWNFIRKGVPIICEIGIREISQSKVSIIKRSSFSSSNDSEQFYSIDMNELFSNISSILEESDEILKKQSQFEDNIKNLNNLEELQDYVNKGNNGFVKAKWSGSENNIDKLTKLGLSIRCIPDNQSETIGKCILTGKEAKLDVIIAKSY